MFEKSFKIIEIHEGSGVVVTHYLKERRKELKKDIEAFKIVAKKYEVFGKEGMTIWV